MPNSDILTRTLAACERAGLRPGERLVAVVLVSLSDPAGGWSGTHRRISELAGWAPRSRQVRRSLAALLEAGVTTVDPGGPVQGGVQATSGRLTLG